MPNASPGGPPGEAPNVPRDTTPTWEIELLVSGAVLFGLFQVPPVVLGAYARYQPHMGEMARLVAPAAAGVALTLFYVLIGCFVLHLALRAYWVALVGAHSVFPHGVRWEKQREYGPIQTELQRDRVRPLPVFIARADNVASLVFASGFVLAAGAVVACVFIAGYSLLVLGLSAALGTRLGLLVGAVLYFACLFAVSGAQIVDYKYGARLAPDSRIARLLRAVLGAAQTLVPLGVRSLGAVITSNVRKRVAWAGTAVVLTAAMVAAFWHIIPSLRVLPSIGGHRFFADAAPNASMPPLRYDTFRGNAEASDRAPSIDSDVATGPYVRLFVPYQPRRHDGVLARACPGLRPLGDDDPYSPAARAAADAVLRCAARVHRATLDGRPVEGLRYRFLVDPRTNRRGFVAYLPVAALPPGEHLLTVAPTPTEREPAAPAYEIPFWK